MKLPPWSFSFLNTWRICPRQCYERYIAKTVKFTGSKESKWGDLVHTGFEHRLAHQQPFSKELIQYEPYAKAIEDQPLEVELKLGIRRDGSACDFFASDVWGRGKIDVGILRADVALLLDWKTGKRREDPYELEVQAVLLQARNPSAVSLSGCYVWLKDGAIGKKHDLSNTAGFWKDLRDTIATIEDHLARDYWPEKQGPLCGWCPCKTCRFNTSSK